MTNKLLLIILLFTVTFSFSQDVGAELFASGFNSPVHIQSAGDDRLFIVEQAGRIKILNTGDGTTNATNFLDITSIVGSGGERGLLSLAFDPDYTTNGFFYLNYTNNSGNTVIARYTVSGDPDIADVDSGEELTTINQPASNHNGGCIAFGPDGYLYVGMGDGGGGGDTSNYAQNGNSLLGKILRIEVGAANTYSIPADNPFVGNTAIRDEIWAIGVRNPWKFSFDSLNGDLWIGDVGQDDYEEINHTANGVPGLNYGWRCYEGNATFNTTGCQSASNYTFPVVDYPRVGFGSVTGGNVYRGSDNPNFYGLYFFADTVSTEIRTIDQSDSYSVTATDVSLSYVVAFGEDNNHELYFSSLNGNIYKIFDENTINVNDNLLSNDISISPNPTKNHIIVKSESGDYRITKIEAFNIIGNKVLAINGEDKISHRIDLTKLNQGVYFIKVYLNNTESVVKKLIIK